jgi:hypothetical protein
MIVYLPVKAKGDKWPQFRNLAKFQMKLSQKLRLAGKSGSK